MSRISVSELAILIVEPSVFQQKVITQELAEAGCRQVDCADTIETALDFMRRYSPDLVISAMYLDDGDGVQLIGQMRSDSHLEEIPFMLVSSERRVHRLDPIRQAGSVAILPKPFKHDDLEKALNATLHFVDPSEIELSAYDVDSLQVLVVDDSEFSRKHISRALESVGITQVVLAENGTQALEAIEENEFDLIFTDFNMPEMDGEELTQHIRTHSNQPSVPILLITSEQNETRLSGVQQAGVNAICNKPFSPEEMKALIKSLLGD
ncbi:response regulator [Motiliproteus sp. SC1-56]|uniref:response regulator transcription factor n=1 Tax=Motiliproteus sp. SC1-56 TaxID=2799565 RepID=UPI001A8CD6E2|nr:response regulator [Motiliproteus sp. SC1-56]